MQKHVSRWFTEEYEVLFSFLNWPLSPCWCVSVDWVLACEPEGRWFDSQSGHMPGCGPGPQLGGHVRGNHALMFLSFSFPCSLSKLATKTWKDCTGSAQGKCTLKCEVGCLGCGETGTYRLLVYEYPFVGYLKSLFIWFHLRYKQIQMVRKMYAWVFSLYHCSLKILKHYI